MLKVNAPDKSEKPKPMKVTKKIKPKRPYMMEGMPCNVSMAKRIILIIFPGLEYSTRYMAENIPIGVDINTDNKTIYRVLIIMGKMPRLSPLNSEKIKFKLI